MARKDRVPNPPKRVQAPRQRRAPIDSADARKQRLLLYALAGSGLLGLAIVIVVFLFARGGGGTDVAATMKAAGCTFNSYPALANKSDHSDVPTPETDVTTWNSFPPTSGPHFGIPAIYDFYDDPVQQTRILHNLEHGGVSIQYGPKTPADTKEKLRAFYDKDPRGLVVAPLPALGGKIAIGAWVDTTPGVGDRGRGYLAKCSRFDDQAVQAFVDSYRAHGPEGFPLDALQPGGT